MAGDNNFLQFDPNKETILSDEAYNASLSRLNGVGAGAASAHLHNKLFYQMSTFVVAMAKVMSNAGFDITDVDLNALTASISDYENSKGLQGIVIANDEITQLILPAYPIAWGTIWNISGSIPNGARYAIVCIEITQNGPNSGAQTQVWFRPEGSEGNGQMVAACRAGGDGDHTATANQVIIPIGANRKIEYKFIAPPSGAIVIFRLQGYIQ